MDCTDQFSNGIVSDKYWANPPSNRPSQGSTLHICGRRWSLLCQWYKMPPPHRHHGEYQCRYTTPSGDICKEISHYFVHYREVVLFQGQKCIATIGESVDSLCRDDADMPKPPYKRKACNLPNVAFVSLFREIIVILESYST